MSATKRAAKPAAGRSLWPWALGLACGVTAASAPLSAALMALVIAPTAAFAWFERQAGRPVTRCMALAGAAALAFPCRAVLSGMPVLAALREVATDPVNLLVCWAAQGVGWLLAQLAPAIAEAVAEHGARQEAARLREARAQLAEEWDLPALAKTNPAETAGRTKA